MKKVVGPYAKRQAFYHLKDKYNASQRLICKTLNLYRSTLNRTKTKDDRVIENKLKELASKYPTRGMDFLLR